MGFGMTTVLLNLHNAGLFGLNTMILAMGICYGGLAQVFAGLLEFRKGNTFGMTAFLSYGLFWISLVFLLILPRIGLGEAPGAAAMASYLFLWGIFTFMMFFGTLKTNRALQFVFLSLTILFWLLAAGDILSNSLITRIAGVEGIICGLSAMYLSFAEILNETAGRTVVPIYPTRK
jgi:succinate-acetate transporter protein